MLATASESETQLPLAMPRCGVMAWKLRAYGSANSSASPSRAIGCPFSVTRPTSSPSEVVLSGRSRHS